MNIINTLLPTLDDGRFFVSPILGCSGGCEYCYLHLRNYSYPRANVITNEELLNIAKKSNVVFGKKGTIVSIGAWGDIFPVKKRELVQYSIDMIKYLLSWGNPVQIMSKNDLSIEDVRDIVSKIQYPGQLLYSSTITTIERWADIEPGVASPEQRLSVCQAFHNYGVATNILIKPFIPSVTDIEISTIAESLLKYNIDFCTIGVLYHAVKQAREDIREIDLYKEHNTEFNHLDCYGTQLIESTQIESLLPYVDYLMKKGIKVFLKSSCVSSNMLNISNPSGYYINRHPYCINCGNCKT